MRVSAFLETAAQETETALERYLSEWSSVAPRLTEAVRYSLFAGGKRLRPALALGACELVGGHAESALSAACAIEMVHTYSLIHDDLPAMDNDDLRRGKPTLHRVSGEAIAILAGDALLTHAFDLAARSGNVEVVRELALGAGVAGMVGGQAQDLESEGKTLELEQLKDIHKNKTGALIRCSVRCGAVIGGASATELSALTEYGEALGLAFQIADDILDVSGDEESLGKRTGADAARGKPTYPALVGLDQARELAEEARWRAVGALDVFGARADVFRELASFVVERRQ